MNLLKYEIHQQTAIVVDMLYSNSFMPLINRPTRITEHCATTLVDNIMANNFSNIRASVEGIMITDISDHFPIFHINSKIVSDNVSEIIVRRAFSQRNKHDFALAVSNFIWNPVLEFSETRCAFTSFHRQVTDLYDTFKFKFKYNNR